MFRYDRPILFLKASIKQTITVPGYYRHDGTYVAPHTKVVNVDPDKQMHHVISGQGTHSQKEAHKKLSKLPGWSDLSPEHQHAHILSSAQNIQTKATKAAQVSVWKKDMLAGNKPKAANIAAFVEFMQKEPEKAGAMLAAVSDKIGWEKLKDLIEQGAIGEKKAAPKAAAPDAQPSEPVEPAAVEDGPKDGDTKPGADGATLVFKDGRWHKQAPEASPATPEQAKVAAEKVSELVAGKGGHYPVLAAKKLTGDGKWQTALPVEQLQMIVDLAKQMQAEATASAAVSGYKKAIKEGKVPTKAQTHAFHSLPEAKQLAITQKLVAEGAHPGNVATLKHQALVKHGFPVKDEPKAEPAAPEPVAPAKPAAAPVAAQPVEASADVIEDVLHNTSPGHNKFWSVAVSKKPNAKGKFVVTKKWGKIGTAGQSKEWHYGNLNAALNAASDWKAKKKANGYYEVDSPTAAPPKDGDTKFEGGDQFIHLNGGWQKVEVLKEVVPEKSGGEISANGWDFGNVSPPDDGPKDGDTKPAADGGTLVFHDGHWHKQAEPFNLPPKVLPSVAKILAISPSEIESWLDGSHSDMAGAAFWSQTPKSNQTKFHKWNQAKASQQPYKNANRSAAIASLFGKADHVLLSDGQFKPRKALIASDAANVVTDAATIQKAVFADKMGVPASLVMKPHPISPELANSFALPFNPFSTNAQAAAVAGDAHAILKVYAALGGKFPKTKQGMVNLLNAMAGVKPGEAAPNPAPKIVIPATKQDAAVMSAAASSKKIDGLAVAVMDKWQQTGGQQGSNPGGTYKDGSGQEWYVKFPKSLDHAKNELLASKLYSAAGVAVPKLRLVEKDGKIGIASKIVPGVSKVGAGMKDVEGSHEGFAVDAWLGNYDAVGTGYDNLLKTPEGKAIRIDVGGSLLFRAQGAPKTDFGDEVTEIDTMRDAGKNSYAAAVFGKISKKDLNESVALVLEIPDDVIEQVVSKFGPGSEAEKKALAAKLIARKNDLAKKFPEADLIANPPKPDLRKLPVEPSKLPTKLDFFNWNGGYGPTAGKPVSSVEAVNAANQKAVDAIYESAMKGDFVAFKKLQFDDVDKQTGAVIGKVPFEQHKSQHVKNFYSTVLDYMEVIANPAAKKMKVWDIGDYSDIDELSDAFKAHFYGVSVGDVPANQRLGFWISLGQADAAHEFMPKKVDYISAANREKGKKSNIGIPDNLRSWMKAVKASGSANQPYRDGKEVDNQGNKTRDVLAAAYKHAVELEEGTLFTKDINMPEAMMKQMLSLEPGHVFQNPGSMCASLKKDWHWGGDAKLKIIAAKGAKGLYNIGVGSHDGEDEITTIPGTRFMLLETKDNKKMAKGKEFTLLMLPPDETYVANIHPKG